jgi:uncharacterized phage protein (TIGR01671 family)
VVEEDKYYIALSINDNIKRDDYNVYMLEVIPETIGQYTGFNDRCGKKIYENDIVYVTGEDENATIEWDEETARFIIHFDGWIADFDNYYGKELEVMGNIYNNPELLGGE